MVTEFQFRKVKNLGDERWWDLHNNLNVLSATELHSWVWLKEYVLYYVTFTTIKKLKRWRWEGKWPIKSRGNYVAHRGKSNNCRGRCNSSGCLSVSVRLYNQTQQSVIRAQISNICQSGFPKLWERYYRNRCTATWGWELKLREIKPNYLSMAYLPWKLPAFSRLQCSKIVISKRSCLWSCCLGGRQILGASYSAVFTELPSSFKAKWYFIVCTGHIFKIRSFLLLDTWLAFIP